MRPNAANFPKWFHMYVFIAIYFVCKQSANISENWHFERGKINTFWIIESNLHRVILLSDAMTVAPFQILTAAKPRLNCQPNRASSGKMAWLQSKMGQFQSKFISQPHCTDSATQKYATFGCAVEKRRVARFSMLLRWAICSFCN